MGGWARISSSSSSSSSSGSGGGGGGGSSSMKMRFCPWTFSDDLCRSSTAGAPAAAVAAGIAAARAALAAKRLSQQFLPLLSAILWAARRAGHTAIARSRGGLRAEASRRREYCSVV